MKPTSPRIILSLAAFVLAVLFLPGCVSPQGPSMEKQLLRQCILRGDSEGAVKIINSGVLDGNVNSEADFIFMTPLYLAAQKNDSNVVQALLAKGANPNLANSSRGTLYAGETPMHGAAKRRSAEALKLLLAHGGNAMMRQHIYGMFSNNETPFDMSVRVIEPPGPVTDMLIEAGAEPEKWEEKAKVLLWDQLAFFAGTHWAVASYKERHGNTNTAIQHYEMASHFYEMASKKVLGSEKWHKFMNSPVMRSVVVVGAIASGAAAQSQGTTIIWGEPNLITAPLDPNTVQGVKTYATKLHDSGERYAAYSKFCAARSAELKRSQTPGPSSDSVK